MKTKEYLAKLHKLTVKDLVKKRTELRAELHTLKMKNAMRSLGQTHMIKTLRRNIARINTLLTHKIQETYGNNMK